MQLWHATRALAEVLADGWVRPMRLPYVYAFTTKEAADHYAAEFGYEAVVAIELDYGKGLIRGRWSPSYAHGADVVCINGPVPLVEPVGAAHDPA